MLGIEGVLARAAFVWGCATIIGAVLGWMLTNPIGRFIGQAIVLVAIVIFIGLTGAPYHHGTP